MAKKEKIGYKPLDTAYTRDIDAWFIVVLIIFFFPIGIWLMWTRTSWKKWLKITVTAVVAALFLVRLVATSVQSYNASRAEETTAFEETTGADAVEATAYDRATADASPLPCISYLASPRPETERL